MGGWNLRFVICAEYLKMLKRAALRMDWNCLFVVPKNGLRNSAIWNNDFAIYRYNPTIVGPLLEQLQSRRTQKLSTQPFSEVTTHRMASTFCWYPLFCPTHANMDTLKRPWCYLIGLEGGWIGQQNFSSKFYQTRGWHWRPWGRH